eukprot:scaffold94572_cov15-Prasinocladus_malaysianus.AAC.1
MSASIAGLLDAGRTPAGHKLPAPGPSEAQRPASEPGNTPQQPRSIPARRPNRLPRKARYVLDKSACPHRTVPLVRKLIRTATGYRAHRAQRWKLVEPSPHTWRPR